MPEPHWDERWQAGPKVIDSWRARARRVTRAPATVNRATMKSLFVGRA